MAAAYWKMVAENIAKGLGPKTIGRLGAGGRLLARAGGVVGVGFLAYELFNSFKENIESEPAYQEMVILQQGNPETSGIKRRLGGAIDGQIGSR